MVPLLFLFVLLHWDAHPLQVRRRRDAQRQRPTKRRARGGRGRLFQGPPFLPTPAHMFRRVDDHCTSNCTGEPPLATLLRALVVYAATYGFLSTRTNVQVNLLSHTAAGSAFGRARSSVAEGGSPLQLLVYWLSTRWSMCAGVGKEGGSWERLPLLSEGCATFPPLLQAGQRCNVSGRLKRASIRGGGGL